MNYSWEPQSFDTELFGFSVAKISQITSPSDIKSLLGEFKKQKVRYATYRLPASNFSMIHGLEKEGFLLVDGTIALDLKSYSSSELSANIREATEEDLGSLKKIASEVFSQTRFYIDPVIPKEKANELYAKWIENSLIGEVADLVYVWEEDGEILGFITLQKKGHIPLIAVAANAQGKGISRKLIYGSFHQFEKWGIKSLEIETQMINIAALRSYQSCGFKVSNSFLTFRWSDKTK